jgi:hypothetical protein
VSLEDIMQNYLSQSQKDKYYRCPFKYVSKIANLTEPEWCFQGLREEGNKDLLLLEGYNVSVTKL